MKKEFCDICGDEINEKNDLNKKISERRKVGKREIVVEIDVAWMIDGTWNNGDVCKYCIFDTIKQIDDRPTYRS